MGSLQLQNFEKGGKYSLFGNPDVTICFLGYDDQDLMFSVLSKKAITCTQLFAIGCVIFVHDKKKDTEQILPLTCQCKAFEYGQYSTLGAFLQRKIQKNRRTSTTRGILTCIE